MTIPESCLVVWRSRKNWAKRHRQFSKRSKQGLKYRIPDYCGDQRRYCAERDKSRSVETQPDPEREWIRSWDRRSRGSMGGKRQPGNSRAITMESQRYLDNRRNKRKTAIFTVIVPRSTQLDAKAQRSVTINRACDRFMEEPCRAFNYSRQNDDPLSGAGSTQLGREPLCRREGKHSGISRRQANPGPLYCGMSPEERRSLARLSSRSEMA